MNSFCAPRRRWTSTHSGISGLLPGSRPARALCGSSACCPGWPRLRTPMCSSHRPIPARSGAAFQSCWSFTTCRSPPIPNGSRGEKVCAAGRSRGSAARRAARVITESDFSKCEITRLLGITASQIDVIYLGASALHPNDSPASRLPLVLYVGSLFNRRHIPELIDGFRRLVARMPEARLEIVGDNRTSPHVDVAELIARSGMSGFVQWRSYIPDGDLSSLYASASTFVFLSDYEGFGLTPLEAMAAGIPTVVLDTPIAREIYGTAALFIPHPEPGADRECARTSSRRR